VCDLCVEKTLFSHHVEKNFFVAAGGLVLERPPQAQFGAICAKSIAKLVGLELFRAHDLYAGNDVVTLDRQPLNASELTLLASGRDRAREQHACQDARHGGVRSFHVNL
jgi:hypothetical protein